MTKPDDRFHALHWPALLMSAGLEPPTRVLAHAHWTMGKSKMSKSKGNVVNPLEALDKWSVDGVRWYLMRNGGSLADDADYSEEELAVSYRVLADQVGNLFSRISSPKVLGKMRAFEEGDRDLEVEEKLNGLRGKVGEFMEGYSVTRACESILEVVATVRLISYVAWIL
jgi:methionyl-tRNA synthetase